MESVTTNQRSTARRIGHKRRFLTPLALLALMAIAAIAIAWQPVTHASAESGTSSWKAASPQPLAPSPSLANDCGLVWRVAPSPNGGTDLNSLSDVDIVSPNDVWAVGYYTVVDGTYHRYQAMAQHWDGTSWSLITVPLAGYESELSSISPLSSSDIWAVGYSKESATGALRTYALHWDGSTWTQVSSPNFQYNSYLDAVAAVSPDAVWAVGGATNQNGTTGATLVLFWDGTSWASVSSPNPDVYNSLKSVTANSVDDMWAAGVTENTDPQAQLERTFTIHCTRLGCTTVLSPNSGVGSNELFSIAALSPTQVWAVGYSVVMTRPYEDDLPLTLQWSGQGWSVLPTPPLPDGFDGGDFEKVIPVSATAVWAVGEVYNHMTSTDQTYAALWNGSSWTVYPPLNVTSFNFFRGGAALSANDLWAVGEARPDINTRQTLIERYNDPCITPSPTPTNIPNPSPTSTPSSCSIQFTDVLVGSTFYSYVHCLACQNILGGYSTGCSTGNPCFKPGNPVTRGQLAKIVSNSARYNDQHTNQSFQDVPVGSTFYAFVERLASRGIIGGYACGGAGEPCVPPANLPYFRPNAQVTRGQTSKIVAIAASLPAPPAGQQTFQDVPANSTFWQWIESLAGAGTIGGYPCGGAGEPCVPPQNRPYFRPNNDVTRGQAAKIVSNTFFPNCQSHQAK